MADNVELNAGTGGATLATDDVGGVHFQIVKLDVGGDGVSAPVSNSNPVPVSDAGGTLTVDGTVTANLSATDNAVIDAIQAATEATQAAVEGTLTVSGTVAVTNAALTELAAAIDTELQCDIVSSALPTGAATAANQTTMIGHLDGVEGLLTTIDGDTGALAAAVKAEDAAHQSGDTGIMALAVRQNSQSDLGADGDYVPLTIDDSGGVRVSIVAGAGSGGTAAADDADFTAGTTQGTPAMGVYESTPTAVTDGDLGTIGITENREVKVAVTSGGVAGIAEDSAAAGGEEGVMVLAVRRDAASSGVGADGDFAALSVTSDGSLRTAISNTVTVASHAVTNAGTFATQVDGAALTALQVIDNPVLVDDAAFTPGTSSVMMAGFQADETAADSVNEGDAGAARMSLDRKVYVIAHEETSTIYQNGTARTPVFLAIDAATSGDNTLLAAQGAGNKIRVHQLFLVAAGTTTVRFESGAGGTALTGQMNLVANTGFVLPYSPVGWFETAANTLLNLELSAAVSVDGNCVYTVVT